VFPDGKSGSYDIPESVIAIGERAFQHCPNVTRITVPGGVNSIDRYAFVHCSGLLGIDVSPANAVFSSADGVLFNKITSTLIQFPGGRAGDYVVPGSVTTIAKYAFAYNHRLHSVVISSGVTHIGESAFYSCRKLQTIRFGETVTSIDEFAFYDCRALTDVYFEGNLPLMYPDSFPVNFKFVVFYYLPGATGWTIQIPFVNETVWLPKMQTDDSMFGVNNGEFGFNISWAKDLVVAVEASDDLDNPNSWETLETIPLTDGAGHFSDPDWASHPNRFYRLRMPE
jgi:hypothetical protein